MTDDAKPEPEIVPFNAITDTRYGPMCFNKNDPWMGRSLGVYGEFSEAEARTICSCLSPGMVAIDAGANVGALTLPMARAVGPEGFVLAFEPQRYVYYCLVANVALNSFTHVRPNWAALGNEKGTIQVPVLDPALVGTSYVGVSLDRDRATLRGVPTESVIIMPIDDLNLTRLDFLKADVEGMELDVLKGGQDTIAHYKPILYLEADKAKQVEALFEWLDEAGYECYWHKPPFFNPKNFNGKTENVFMDGEGRQVVSTNWLCVHSSWGISIDGDRVQRGHVYDGPNDTTDDDAKRCVRPSLGVKEGDDASGAGPSPTGDAGAVGVGVSVDAGVAGSSSATDAAA